MSRFLQGRSNAFEPGRLKMLQAVYDWLEDVVDDKSKLATQLLAVPDDHATFEQVLYHVGESFGWTKCQGAEK